MVGDRNNYVKKTLLFTGIKIRMYIKRNYIQHATYFL